MPDENVEDHDTEIVLPTRKAGRPSKMDIDRKENEMKAFAEAVKKFAKRIHRKVSARGWCYLMETVRLINKNQFDEVESTINECRKKGYLPIDFVLEDSSRQFYYTEDIMIETMDPVEYVSEKLDRLEEIATDKDDVTFWSTQKCYLQMMVEKIDLVELFRPVCREYHIPIANAKGWSDLHSRNSLATRFKEAEAHGLKTVLLYYGDFDYAGIKISETLVENLADIKDATGWDPSNLVVDRIGLNYDFIIDNKLVWIDNLISGKGKPPDLKKKYIRDYIQKYGENKVEANAILVIEDIAIKQLKDAIAKYLGDNPLENYNTKVKETQVAVDALMKKLGIYDQIKRWKESLKNSDLDSNYGTSQVNNRIDEDKMKSPDATTKEPASAQLTSTLQKMVDAAELKAQKEAEYSKMFPKSKGDKVNEHPTKPHARFKCPVCRQTRTEEVDAPVLEAPSMQSMPQGTLWDVEHFLYIIPDGTKYPAYIMKKCEQCEAKDKKSPDPIAEPKETEIDE